MLGVNLVIIELENQLGKIEGLKKEVIEMGNSL